MTKTSMKKLFLDLYRAGTENEVEDVLASHRTIVDNPDNWQPLNKDDNNYSIIQNQQGHPVDALVEKLTNAIDAVLTRKCLETGICPTSKKAPKTMAAALRRFFPKDVWRNERASDEQALDIQLLASGPPKKSSLVVYDRGEGQEPDEFPNTFLSLMRGNKKDIPFVQGLYNMGGTGAMFFCGQRKYQLIGSRRYDGKSDFGFTLTRRHPLSDSEETSKRASWYEYLLIDGQIPRFAMKAPLQGLGLTDRDFDTGTIIKLYSYLLPAGLRTNISQDLFQSISEKLLEPILPIWVADNKRRYPKANLVDRPVEGLRRSLAQKQRRLVDRHLRFKPKGEFGEITVDCYVFKVTVKGKTVAEMRKSLRDQFFKNRGSVLFSVNGQVHGAWSSQFISSSLKMSLLKDHVLILVDCTKVKTEFRNDLFMASRDRMATTEQSAQLRDVLRSVLGKGELRDIYEQRKQGLGVDSGGATKAIKQYVRSLTFQPRLQKLLAGQLDLDEVSNLSGGGENESGRKQPREPKTPEDNRESELTKSFQGKRFPSYFELAKPSAHEESTPAARIPLSGTRRVKFETDVEDQYFNRSDRPGYLELALLSHRNHSRQGENEKRSPRSKRRQLELSDLVYVERSGPESGEIVLRITPTKKARVGDSIEIQATLSGDLTDLTQWFWVRIVADKKKKKGKP